MNHQSFAQLPDFLEAGYSGLWVVSHEHEEAQAAIIQAASSDSSYLFLRWDCVDGCRPLASADAHGFDKSNSPIWPLTNTPPLVEGQRMVMFLHNFHKFLESAPILQALHNAIYAGKSRGLHYLVLSPTSSIPVELAKDFAIFDYPLPTLNEIDEICHSLDPQAGADDAVLEAARGLTRREAENSLALSLRLHGEYQAPFISILKARAIAKSGVLTLEQPSTSFADLAGLEGAKTLITRACSPNPLGIRPKGALLVGVPGGGKSHLARASAAATGRDLFRLDVGRLLHKHVGESESNLRQALAVIEAVGKSLVFIDEGEKAFAGSSSGEGDSGVMRRLFGSLLTWMEERTCDAFIIFTSNNVSQLPPEFLRAGRWNFEIFVDLPTTEEKQQIWDLYLKKYQIQEKPTFSDEGWVGGEIKQACELAALLQTSLADAARKVRITSRSRPDQLQELRAYAAQAGCLSATTGGPYQKGETTTTTARKISKPSNN